MTMRTEALFLNGSEDGEPVEMGHSEIEHQKVGLVLPEERNDVEAVVGRRDHGTPQVVLENRADARPGEMMIFSNDDGISHSVRESIHRHRRGMLGRRHATSRPVRTYVGSD